MKTVLGQKYLTLSREEEAERDSKYKGKRMTGGTAKEMKGIGLSPKGHQNL